MGRRWHFWNLFEPSRSFVADPSYLLNICLALRGLRAHRCGFSLIINGALQMGCRTATRQRTGEAGHLPFPLAAAGINGPRVGDAEATAPRAPAAGARPPSAHGPAARPVPFRPGDPAQPAALPAPQSGLRLPRALNASFQTRRSVAANPLVLGLCSGERPRAESALRAPRRGGTWAGRGGLPGPLASAPLNGGSARQAAVRPAFPALVFKALFYLLGKERVGPWIVSHCIMWRIRATPHPGVLIKAARSHLHPRLTWTCFPGLWKS